MDKEKEIFLKYVTSFDMNNPKIKLKIAHSLRVLDLSTILAEKLNLTIEETELIKLISLLHDIGRFEQLKLTNSFDDCIFDHAKSGVEYLFQEGFIKNYLKDDKNYEIIRNAIYYHNKYVDDIPSFDEATSKYINLIRDLDKIDIVNAINLNYDVYFKKEEVPKSYIDEFFQAKSIRKVGLNCPSKSFMTTCAFVYDINYPESFEILKERNYYEKYFAKAKVAIESEKLYEEIKENVRKKVKESIYVR